MFIRDNIKLEFKITDTNYRIYCEYQTINLFGLKLDKNTKLELIELNNNGLDVIKVYDLNNKACLDDLLLTKELADKMLIGLIQIASELTIDFGYYVPDNFFNLSDKIEYFLSNYDKLTKLVKL